MKYCKYCKREVNPVMKTNWFVLIFLSIVTCGVWLFIYALYYFTFKHAQCPFCGYKL